MLGYDFVPTDDLFFWTEHFPVLFLPPYVPPNLYPIMVIFQRNPYQNGKDFFGKITMSGCKFGGGGQNPREFEGRGKCSVQKKSSSPISLTNFSANHIEIIETSLLWKICKNSKFWFVQIWLQNQSKPIFKSSRTPGKLFLEYWTQFFIKMSFWKKITNFTPKMQKVLLSVLKIQKSITIWQFCFWSKDFSYVSPPPQVLGFWYSSGVSFLRRNFGCLIFQTNLYSNWDVWGLFLRRRFVTEFSFKLHSGLMRIIHCKKF